MYIDSSSNGTINHQDANSPAVTAYQSNDLAPPSAPPPEQSVLANQSKGKAKVLYDYFASNDKELSLIADEVYRLRAFIIDPTGKEHPMELIFMGLISRYREYWLNSSV